MTETIEETNERVRQLNALADGLVSQGSYHLAAMKYTQASNKLQVSIAILYAYHTHTMEPSLLHMYFIWNLIYFLYK